MSMNNLRSVFIALTCAAAWFPAMDAFAQGGRVESDRPIYGQQLMTEPERLQYQDRMRSARTDEARARVREEHHAAMRERAKARGIELPEEPPERGMGSARGGGMGSGMGSGAGGGMGGSGGRGSGGNR